MLLSLFAVVKQPNAGRNSFVSLCVVSFFLLLLFHLRRIYISFYRFIGLRHFVESLLFSNVFAQVLEKKKKQRKKMQRSV